MTSMSNVGFLKRVIMPTQAGYGFTKHSNVSVQPGQQLQFQSLLA